MVGWPGDKRWSFAVAKGEYDKDGKPADEKLLVHHYAFDVSSRSLLPSWVSEDRLRAYLQDPTKNAPPKERLQAKCPAGHTAYIDQITMDQILLTGELADLTQGYLSVEQHDSVRHALGFKKSELCSASCPHCSSDR